VATAVRAADNSDPPIEGRADKADHLIEAKAVVNLVLLIVVKAGRAALAEDSEVPVVLAVRVVPEARE
jgi:hypothetical protein